MYHTCSERRWLKCTLFKTVSVWSNIITSSSGGGGGGGGFATG